MTSRSIDTWRDDQAYESYIGRWSRLVAPLFLRWLPVGPSAAWCDVGCGTGALTHAILSTQNPTRVLAVAPSRRYLAAARQLAAPRVARRPGSDRGGTDPVYAV